MKSTRGFGFTVKCRNRLTTSLSVRILDWAGPEGTMTQRKDKDQSLTSEFWEIKESTKSESSANIGGKGTILVVHLQQTPQWS